MGKKRRVWWIVGGLTLFVIITAVALFVMRDSTNEALEREVDSIVADYGFVENTTTSYNVPSGPKDELQRIYLIDHLSQSEMADIADRIKTACRGCRLWESGIAGHMSVYYAESQSDPRGMMRVTLMETLFRSSGGGTGSSIWHSGLVVHRYRRDGLWAKVRRLLPW